MAVKTAARTRGTAREVREAMREAAEILAGTPAAAGLPRPPAEINVRAIRRKLGMTQAAFAAHFGFDLGALRDWEQGRRRPDQAATTLLRVIDRDPQAAEDVFRVA